MDGVYRRLLLPILLNNHHFHHNNNHTVNSSNSSIISGVVVAAAAVWRGAVAWMAQMALLLALEMLSPGAQDRMLLGASLRVKAMASK